MVRRISLYKFKASVRDIDDRKYLAVRIVDGVIKVGAMISLDKLLCVVVVYRLFRFTEMCTILITH